MEVINEAVSEAVATGCDTHCTDNWNPGCCENN